MSNRERIEEYKRQIAEQVSDSQYIKAAHKEFSKAWIKHRFFRRAYISSFFFFVLPFGVFLFGESKLHDLPELILGGIYMWVIFNIVMLLWNKFIWKLKDPSN